MANLRMSGALGMRRQRGLESVGSWVGSWVRLLASFLFVCLSVCLFVSLIVHWLHGSNKNYGSNQKPKERALFEHITRPIAEGPTASNVDLPKRYLQVGTKRM